MPQIWAIPVNLVPGRRECTSASCWQPVPRVTSFRSSATVHRRAPASAQTCRRVPQGRPTQIARLGPVLFCLRIPIRSPHLPQDLGQPGTICVRVAERSAICSSLERRPDLVRVLPAGRVVAVRRDGVGDRVAVETAVAPGCVQSVESLLRSWEAKEITSRSPGFKLVCW